MIVKMSWQMLEVDHCIMTICIHLNLSGLFKIVQMQELEILLHVRDMSQSGKNTQSIEPATLSLEYVECYKDLKKSGMESTKTRAKSTPS